MHFSIGILRSFFKYSITVAFLINGLIAILLCERRGVSNLLRPRGYFKDSERCAWREETGFPKTGCFIVYAVS